MKIAIAGSGALGSGFGAMLYRQGYDVTLMMDGSLRKQLYKKVYI